MAVLLLFFLSFQKSKKSLKDKRWILLLSLKGAQSFSLSNLLLAKVSFSFSSAKSLKAPLANGAPYKTGTGFVRREASGLAFL
jgi:hypothetical protein